MTTDPLNTPLSDDEYDALDSLLAGLGDDSMDVARLEGYLTAIVIGPADLQPAQWLPKVWDAVRHGDSAAASALVLRHYHYMQKWMKLDPGSFEAIYECGGTWTARAWCQGFMDGVQLDADAWTPLQISQPAWLEPFQQLSAGGEEGRWVDEVTPAVIQINEYWTAQRQPAVKAAKVGRNDPCPCGSGKKFKKCCDQ